MILKLTMIGLKQISDPVEVAKLSFMYVKSTLTSDRSVAIESSAMGDRPFAGKSHTIHSICTNDFDYIAI
jgi:hypothetical protein